MSVSAKVGAIFHNFRQIVAEFYAEKVKTLKN